VTRALGVPTGKGETVELDPEKIKAEAVYDLYSHIHEIFEMKRPVDNYRG
jgi:hypothetical protein